MSDFEEQTPETTDDWLGQLAEAAVAPVGAQADGSVPQPVLVLPRLERQRPVRPPVVPPLVWYVAGGFLALIVAVSLIAVLVGRASMVVVPQVVGRSIADARVTLKNLDLTANVEDRYSSEPKGSVLAQTPAAGGEIRKGSSVRLIVSAGTEQFVMKDFTGASLIYAKSWLESQGLIVTVESVMSDLASDTVLSTDPAPGATVTTGQTVRVQVASQQGSSGMVQPYRMTGLSIVIDPAPTTGPTDPGLAVARRLQALLEASGAAVRVTRTGNDTSTADSDRAAKVAETSSTVGLGLQVLDGGPGGRVVSAPSTATPFIGPSSSALANALERSLLAGLQPVSRVLPTAQDPVLGGVNMPWVRITLGSTTATEDSASFANAGWPDVAARAIYRALGEVYGTREAQ